MDFIHDFANRSWHLSGSVSPSYVSGTSTALVATQRASSRYYQRPDADYLAVDSAVTSLFGYSAQGAISKQSGVWRLSTGVSAISPGYEVNDVGFSTTADRISTNLSVGYEQTRPGRHFRAWNVHVAPALAWNYGRDLIEASTTISGRVQLPNFSSFDGRLSYNPTTLNPQLTRGGPLTESPPGYSASLDFSTASQSRVSVRTGVAYGEDRSGAWQRNANLRLTLRTGEKLDLSLGPTFEQSHTTAQYVTTVTDPTATHTFGRRFVFADLWQNTLSVDTRVNVTLTPRTTIEIFAQPLLSSGDYENLKELRSPGTFEFDRYGADEGTITASDARRHFQIDPDGAGPAGQFQLNNEDFNIRSLRFNAVFRWEWRPGSTFFLVWQQKRSGRLAAYDPDSPHERAGNFQLGREAGDLFKLRPDNVFVIKASYWLNP